MSVKHESIISDEIIYCFVNFEPGFPTVHVVPSAVVADAITREHRIWLDTPGKNGQAHKENSMRRIRPKQVGMPEDWMNQYFEAWDQFT